MSRYEPEPFKDANYSKDFIIFKVKNRFLCKFSTKAVQKLWYNAKIALKLALSAIILTDYEQKTLRSVFQNPLPPAFKYLTHGHCGIFYCFCQCLAITLAILAESVFARIKKPRQLFGNRDSPIDQCQRNLEG